MKKHFSYTVETRIKEPCGLRTFVLKPRNIRTCFAKQGQGNSYMRVTTKL